MPANVKFRIDGRVYDNVVDEFDVLYTYDKDTNTAIASASSEIEVRGEDDIAVVESFFEDCEGRKKILDVEIIPSCTDELKGFQLKAGGISYAPSACQAVLNVERRNTSCWSELKDSVYWKGGLSEAFNNGSIRCPKVYYCTQMSSFMSALMFALRSILLPILLILEAIESVLNILPGVNLNIPSLDDWDNLLTGCGRYHHAPLIKDIMAFRLQECGLSFSSTILVDDPVYQNTGLFEAAIDKGTRRTENVGFAEGNSVNLTIGEILNGLKEVFNAEYRIIGSTLHFERKDWFDERRDTELVNVETAYPDRAEDPATYVFNTQSSYAYWRGEFKKDQFDDQGNRLFTRNYTDIVEWNDPPAPLDEEWQKGEKKAEVPFTGVRCMFDTITCGKGDGADVADLRIDVFRSGQTISFGFQRDRAVILERHQCEANKLLVFEPGFNYDDAHVIRRPANFNNAFNRQCYDYNYPLYFNAEYDIPELYQDFHYIDNPREAPYNDYYQIETFEYVPEDFCAAAKLVDQNFADLYVQTKYGRGYPDEIELDFNRCIIRINKIRIPCR